MTRQVRQKFGEWEGFENRQIHEYRIVAEEDFWITAYKSPSTEKPVWVLIKASRFWSQDEILTWAEVCYVKLTGKMIE